MEKIKITLDKEIFKGDILDIGFDNHGIMYKACKEVEDEIAIAYYLEEEDEKEKPYDTCLMFLAFKEMLLKRNKIKLLNKVQRLLKDDGYIHIWDIIKKRGKFLNEDLEVNLPSGEKKDIRLKDNNYIKEVNIPDTLNIIKEYFEIQEMKTYDKIFYIKAKKRGEI